MTIPKIIHQLWIGDKPRPDIFMETWREKHINMGYEYILWNEEEFEKRNFKSSLQDKIDQMEEINGKADILRWEILYEYGGIFIDADSVCLHPIDELINDKAFFCYENEHARGAGWSDEYGLALSHSHPTLSTGTMAFPKHHDLPKMAIEWIKTHNISHKSTNYRAWVTVGPGLLTRLYFKNEWNDIIIYPSYYFLPYHGSGIYYAGHGKSYAHQYWGSSDNVNQQNYNEFTEIQLPEFLQEPKESVSLLISSYNTKAVYLSECIESIINQAGNIHMEIVWINDGSDELHTRLLNFKLENLKKRTKNITVCYYENEGNKGIGYTLNRGITLCNNEIIFKMDSDDIMFPNRIMDQLEFMKEHEDCVICGAQVDAFYENIDYAQPGSHHKTITWEEFKEKKPHWFINHPTVCYKKSAVLAAGNYDPKLTKMAEDFDLELRMLRKFGKVYNMESSLLNYRLHKDQITHNGGIGGKEYWDMVRNKIIEKVMNIQD